MPNNKSGFATILVISILSIAALIGTSLLYMIRVQLRGATSYIAKLQAKYLAEAGVNYARQVLASDKNLNSFDYYQDIYRTTFQGSDVDLDLDGVTESKWFYVKDNDGNEVGRFAVLVKDEAAKININTAAKYNEGGAIQGVSVYEISLKKLLDSLDLDGETVTEGILNYRYGIDMKPGVKNFDDNGNNYSLENDNLDNDADGIIDESAEGIDEPQEFNMHSPYGDDQPFVVLDELKRTGHINKKTLQTISNFVTVSSKDKETDFLGSLRQNINYIKVDNLAKIMLDRGVSDSWQKAVNIIDSLDKNLGRTTFFKQSAILDCNNVSKPNPGQPTGNWKWVNGQYECDVPGGTGSWEWDLPFLSDGDYYCFIYGKSGEPVGDVQIQGFIQEGMHHSDAFIKTTNKKINIKDGKFSLGIQNNEEYKTCYFKNIELIPEDISGGFGSLTKEYHGVEAVRINEIMVKPKIRKDTAATSGGPLGDWVWQDSFFVNANPESGTEGQGTWIFNNIPMGYYYLKIFGKEHEFIGDVEIGGYTLTAMRDSQYFDVNKTVYVDQSRSLTIKIQNNFKDKTCYFKGIELSQQPDTEYIEIINISNNSVDLSGWVIETTGKEGASAFIPQGTTIAPYDYLVLCVDKDDEAQEVESNHIAFGNTWGTQKATQLDFFKKLDRDFDFLKDNPIQGEDYLILKDADGYIVDKIEYLNSQVANYISLERADPTEQKDNNGDSEFDEWYLTNDLSGGTPGQINNNNGIKIDEFSNHNIQEVNVRNYSATNILDLLDVSKSDNWQNIELSDVSLIIDSLTISGTTLYPKNNHLIGWTEIYSQGGGFFSNTLGEEGFWQWRNLDNGQFFLNIKGELNEAVTVSYKKSDGSWQILAQDMIPNQEGMIYCGLINIGNGSEFATASNILEIKLENNSDSGKAHFYFLRLDPMQEIYGKININTASQEALECLPNIDSQASATIINNRPFGNKDGFNKGIGDLFSIDIFFGEANRIDKLKSFSNLITARSDVFEIIARAQVLDAGNVIANQEIKTIIERK